MSWGGQPQQQYGGYGQPPPQQYGQPRYGQQPAYGAPPAQNYGAPQQAYGRPAAPQGYGGPPPGQQQQAYGAPPASQGYGGHGAAPRPAYGAPPQQAYGAPPQQAYGAPPGQVGGYGAPPAAAPPGVSPELWNWFQTVDRDHSGKITSTELQQALANGNWTPFNSETCRLMIGMFDKDRSGTIDIHEFAALWRYIQDWKSCFDRFDTDRSGNIDANELGNALNTFGYRLSPQFSQMVVRTFDRKHGGRNINFDDFIQSCVLLKSLTDKFRVKDTNQNGTIRIAYEEFLEMVLDTKLSGL